MASGVRVMEKPIQLQNHHQQQQPPPPQHEALKCPRCDSANTKFCYYNNYSLSQPRHFCKACKRYWTRGGTLRNVPVGGGCRKNKRAKRPITSTNTHATSNPSDHQNHTNPNPNPNPNPNLDRLPSSTTSNSNHHLNPLFYGLLPQNPNFPRFDARVSGVNDGLVAGYDLLQSHMNVSGLGFSSSAPGASLMASHAQNSSLSFSNYPTNSMYGGGNSTSSSTSAPTMASLLASSLNQQQRFMGFSAYDGGSMVKDPKMEAIQNRMDQWNNNFHHHGQNKDDQIEAVDPNNSLLWDTTTPGGDGGGWLDPSNNIGSSVPSLI